MRTAITPVTTQKDAESLQAELEGHGSEEEAEGQHGTQ